MVLAVGGAKVDDLAGFFRRIWSLGEAGVKVPIALVRDGETTQINVASADRDRYLKAPRLHFEQEGRRVSPISLSDVEEVNGCRDADGCRPLDAAVQKA